MIILIHACCVSRGAGIRGDSDFGFWPPKTCPRPLVPLRRPRPIHSTRPAAGMRFALELVPLRRPRPLRDPLRGEGLGCSLTRAIWLVAPRQMDLSLSLGNWVRGERREVEGGRISLWIFSEAA
jgi:hypothetical protein